MLTFFCFSINATAQITWWNTSENEKAFLGVEADKISKEKAQILGFENIYGQLIDKIIEKSAAEAASLQPFDYLVGIDNEEMDWTTDLTDLLSKYKAGDKATIHFYRKGKKRQVQVEFLPKESNYFSGNVFKKSIFTEKEPFLGVSESRNSDDDELGVAVNIVEGSTADEMGLRDGDIIQEINGFKMVDWSDISRAINMLEVDDQIKVHYTRVGKAYDASSTIKTRPNRGYSISNFWQDDEQSDRAFLGVYSEDLSKEKADQLGIDNPYGSYVTSVFGNSAAADGGLKPFDYIYGIDEYRVGEDQNLSDILRKYKAGEKAVVHFVRKGKNYQFNITFGKRSEAKEPGNRERCEDPFLGVQESERSQTEKGVRVSVVGKSTAQSLGLRSGDVITSINGYPMIDWSDIGPAVDMMNVGDNIKINYFRAGQKMEASGKIGSYCDTYGQRSNAPNIWTAKVDDAIKLEEVKIDIHDLPANRIRSINQDLDLELGVSNSLTVNKLLFSPNNRLGLLELQFELPEKGKTMIQIFNNQGRQVYTYDLGYFSGEFSDQVDLLQNGTGTYYLSVQQENKSMVKELRITK